MKPEAACPHGQRGPHTELHRHRCFLPDLAEFTVPLLRVPSLTARCSLEVSMGCFRNKKCVAEREGFEPSVACTTHDFQSCTFSHSVTSPRLCMECIIDALSQPRPRLHDVIVKLVELSVLENTRWLTCKTYGDPLARIHAHGCTGATSHNSRNEFGERRGWDSNPRWSRPHT